MQQQVVMPQNLGMAPYGHPEQNENPSFPVPPFLPQLEINPPASAPLHSQAFSFDAAGDDASIETPKLITLDTLKSMLPEGSDDRPKPGLLPDGQAYAPGPPQAKNQYLLFSSKTAYIAYYTNYYFSEANLARDTYILGLMVDGNCLPVAKLLEFPRLVAVHATPVDVETVVAANKLLEIVRNSSVGPCIRRVDGIPLARADVVSAPPTVTVSPDSFSNHNGFEAYSPAVNNANSSLVWSPYTQQPVIYQEAPQNAHAPVTTASSQPQQNWANQGNSPRAAQQVLAQQPYNNMMLAMSTLNLAAGPGGQQVRYFTQPPTATGNNAGVQSDFYQTAAAAAAQHHPGLFFLNPGGMVLAATPHSFATFGHQGQTAGGFVTTTGQQLPHHGLMAPPGMVNLQQQQQALAAALQHQQQFVAMQQGFMANPAALGQYTQGLANHHQMLQHANAAIQNAGAGGGNGGGPPPGLSQPVGHWSVNGAQNAIFSPPPMQAQPTQQQQQQQHVVMQTQQQQQQTASPPGMPKGGEVAAVAVGNSSAVPSRVPSNAAPVPSSSGRSSSSGIASGVSSQNSSSVVAVSSGSSSVSSSSTASGLDSTNTTTAATAASTTNNNKHPYAAVVAKCSPKPEEVSVAKLGSAPPNPMYHHQTPSAGGGPRGNKAGGGGGGYYRPKMNNGSGTFEENNNHGGFGGGGGGSWRGGHHHRGGPGMRGGGGRGGFMQHHNNNNNNNNSNSQQAGAGGAGGVYNQSSGSSAAAAATNSAAAVGRASSGEPPVATVGVAAAAAAAATAGKRAEAPTAATAQGKVTLAQEG